MEGDGGRQPGRIGAEELYTGDGRRKGMGDRRGNLFIYCFSRPRIDKSLTSEVVTLYKYVHLLLLLGVGNRSSKRAGSKREMQKTYFLYY